jgi:hypothetical protein
MLLRPTPASLRAFVAGLLLVAPVLAFAASSGGGDSFSKIKADYEQAQGARNLDLDSAKKLVERCLTLASKTRDDDDRFGCWSLVLSLRSTTGSAELDKDASQALDRLVEHFANDEERMVPVVCRSLQTDAATREKLFKKTKSKSVQAACLSAEAAGLLAKGSSAALSEAERKTAEGLYDQIQKTYGKELDPRTKKPWSASIEQDRFALDHLTIGVLAPDIEGGDLAGVNFKLSDYRGKVVVIDFWGNW